MCAFIDICHLGNAVCANSIEILHIASAETSAEPYQVSVKDPPGNVHGKVFWVHLKESSESSLEAQCWIVTVMYVLFKPLDRRVEREPVDFTDKVTITWELAWIYSVTGCPTDCSSWTRN